MQVRFRVRARGLGLLKGFATGILQGSLCKGPWDSESSAWGSRVLGGFGRQSFRKLGFRVQGLGFRFES